MNAIDTRRPASPDEMSQAAEVIIPAAELQRLYDAARAERRREARKQARAQRARTGLILAQTAAIGALALACVYMAENYKVEVVPVLVRDDGSITTTTSFAALPPDVRASALPNVLWHYVKLRESWTSGQAQEAWNVVSALSTRPVRDAFQAWYRKENPESPQRLYGERTTVRVTFRNVEKLPGSDDSYRVWFDRIESINGQDKRPVPYSAQLRFRYITPETRIPWPQRASFNAPAIQIWEYPGAQQEGVVGP